MSHARQIRKIEDVLPPPAPDAEVERRWSEGRRRRRMLEGAWEEDLRDALSPLVDRRRLERWRELDLSKNIFASIIRQIAVLYDRAPVVYREESDPLAEMALTKALDKAGLWQIAAANQQYVIGLRESALKVHAYETGGVRRLGYEIVTADHIHATASPDAPDEPTKVQVYRLRKTKSGDLQWTRDTWTIEDPETPSYSVDALDGSDITAELEGVSAVIGDAYTWRYADGTPFIPVVLYHALRTGRMWDWARGIELVDGSLRIAGLWTMWQHVVRDTSWPQRYTIGLEVQGVEVRDGMATVLTDQASVLAFHSRPGISGSAGQFEPGGDPEALGRAIQAFASDLAGGLDISPAEVKREHGDARSGYAIEVTRDGQREAQRRFAPQQRRGDLTLLRQSAALLGLPDEGWNIRYTGVPSTFSERQLLIEEYEMRAAHGLASPVQVLARLDDISEDEARARLLQIAEDNVRFRAVMQLANSMEEEGE